MGRVPYSRWSMSLFTGRANPLSWCRRRFPWSCCSADHRNSPVARGQGGRCPYLHAVHVVRERRLRAMLRHERQTVAMELAAAIHHSRDGGRVTNCGLRAPKTASSGRRPGVLTEPDPQGQERPRTFPRHSQVASEPQPLLLSASVRCTTAHWSPFSSSARCWSEGRRRRS